VVVSPRAGALTSGVPTRVRLALRALRHRNLRLFFTGQGISLVGTWMQQVAIGWLVYRLTDSALLLGVIGFGGRFPAFLMAPFAGALADRWDRYRMVMAAQVCAMLQAVALAVLVLSGSVEVWHLVALSVVSGLINGVDVPARQSLLVHLVDGTDDLPNAIALNSSMFNAARLVGPALAGVLIGQAGEGFVFALNAVSYIAVLGALAAVRLPRGVGTATGPVLQNIMEGFAYAFGFRPIRDLILLLGLIALVGIPYTILLPIFARDVLGGDAGTLGLLSSSAGLGALAGALFLASRDGVRGLGRVIARSTVLFGVSLAGFALSRDVWLSSVFLVASGFGVMLTTASINTVLQTLVDEGMRGRVMSLYTMAFVGMSPLGSLAGGLLAGWMGAPRTVLLGGVGCLLVGAWFTRRVPALRELVVPGERRTEIVPELARGLQEATDPRARG
jgi:MFS family permease